MKRFIKASTNSDLVNLLQEHGIDTQLANYELSARTYQRYSNGPVYNKKFKCPGDYLAYFSMLFHSSPTADRIAKYYGSLEDFASDMLDSYPTVDDIAEEASSCWWGDGDDYIYYLKNLDTEQYLYEANYDEEDIDEEDWEGVDEEDWED